LGWVQQNFDAYDASYKSASIYTTTHLYNLYKYSAEVHEVGVT